MYVQCPIMNVVCAMKQERKCILSSLNTRYISCKYIVWGLVDQTKGKKLN